jgi:hypothetical protein
MKKITFFAGIVFSQGLVQDIMQELSKHPYNDVAPLISKMQAEASQQAAPPGRPPLAAGPEEKKGDAGTPPAKD